MANNRIFYACQGVAIAPTGVASTDSNIKVLHGVQSIGITTNFNLEQAFELGQIQIYENIEGTPEVEVTLEKVIDGHPLIYHTATQNATSASLVNRAAEQCIIALGIFPETNDVITGNAPAEVVMSGMYLSSISYTLAGDGNSTESVSFVGNNKTWSTTAAYLTTNNTAEIPGSTVGTDAPLGSGVSRREDVLLSQCQLPTSILGVDTAVLGNADNNNVHIQNFTCSTDLSREDILELGRRTPYYRAPNYPVEVTSEFEIISVSGDFINANEDADSNTSAEKIQMATKTGLIIDLGSNNRLSSVSYGGGDATGGNATSTYSYTNFNDLTVRASGVMQDPATGVGQL